MSSSSSSSSLSSSSSAAAPLEADVPAPAARAGAPAGPPRKLSMLQKLERRARSDPLVFGFLGLTVGALGGGMWSLLKDNKAQSQLMMRFRVGFQFSTILALVGCASARARARVLVGCGTRGLARGAPRAQAAHRARKADLTHQHSLLLPYSGIYWRANDAGPRAVPKLDAAAFEAKAGAAIVEREVVQ
jgi:hypothetical protein